MMTVRAIGLVLIIDSSDIVDLTAMCFMCFFGPFVKKKKHSCLKHELLLYSDISSVAAAAKVVMGYQLNECVHN